MSYIGNIIKETESNENFRKVLYTGDKGRLVVMSIPPGGEVGEETHSHVEQTLFFHSGNGTAFLDGMEEAVGAGDVVVVPAGVNHNFKNTGSDPLKIYTIYTPPNHIDGRIHANKEDADNDEKDEAFGESVK